MGKEAWRVPMDRLVRRVVRQRDRRERKEGDRSAQGP